MTTTRTHNHTESQQLLQAIAHEELQNVPKLIEAAHPKNEQLLMQSRAFARLLQSPNSCTLL